MASSKRSQSKIKTRMMTAGIFRFQLQEENTPSNWALKKIKHRLSRVKFMVIKDPDRLLSEDDLYQFEPSKSFIVKGNLEFRSILSNFGALKNNKIIIIDQSHNGIFIPDIIETNQRTVLEIDIKKFLQEVTGYSSWPEVIREYPCREICKEKWAEFIKVFKQHLDEGLLSLTNTDVRKIAAEAIVGFSLTSEPDLIKSLELGISGMVVWNKLIKYFGVKETKEIQSSLQKIPPPVGYLFDPSKVENAIRGIGGIAILCQHIENPGEALALFDPRFYEFRTFKRSTFPKDFQYIPSIQKAVEKFEESLDQKSWDLFIEKLDAKESSNVINVLLKEKLSPKIVFLCLIQITADFLDDSQIAAKVQKYSKLHDVLEELPDLIENSIECQKLRILFKQLYRSYEKLGHLDRLVKSLKLKNPKNIPLTSILEPWIIQRLCTIEYELANLEDEWNRISVYQSFPKWVKDIVETIKARIKTKVEFATSLVKELNIIFQKLINAHYVNLHKQNILTTSEFLSKILKPSIRKRKVKRPTVVLLFDGLRYDLWLILFANLFYEKFDQKDIIPALTQLPSTTSYSRRSLFAGLLPKDFKISAPESNLLEKALHKLGLMKGKLENAEDFLSISKAIKMALRSKEEDILFLVLNISDSLSHNIDYGIAELFRIIGGLRETVQSILNSISHESDIFVVSDHGFTKIGRKTKTIKNAEVYYRYAFLPDEPREDIKNMSVVFTTQEIGLGGSGYIIFPYTEWTFLREGGRDITDFYSHGGISLEEMIVPFTTVQMF